MDVKLCQKAHLANVKTWMMRLPVLGHNSGIAATILFITNKSVFAYYDPQRHQIMPYHPHPGVGLMDPVVGMERLA